MKSKNINLVLLAVCLSGCATKEQTYWEKKKGTVVIHHVRKTNHGIVDRRDTLTQDAIKPAEYHVYDLGRLPDGNGGVHESHSWYRVEQSQSVNTMLPKIASATRGVRTSVKSPTYTPMPPDQRINDAVTSAQQAKSDLDAAKSKIDEQLAQDNNLRGEMQTTLDQLKSQIDAGFSAPHPATPAPTTDAGKAGQQAVDQLAVWGNTIKQP